MKPLAVQTAALAASNGMPGFGYFMEQGLGKTSTALMDFLERVAEGTATRMVVIAPSSFRSGWVEEIEKQGFSLTPHIFDIDSDWINQRFLKTNFQSPPVLIVNYEAARLPRVMEYIAKFIAEAKGRFLAIDESIQIATHDSVQTIAVLTMAKDFEFVRILSGKPVNSGPHNLWAQMRAIKRLEGKNFYSFKTAFCKLGGFKGKKVVGAQNEEILAELIDPYVFRATKADWTDLPPKTYTVREYKMSPEMQRMYSSMEDDFLLFLENEQLVTVDAAISKYIKMAQIQAGFIIDEKGKAHELVDPAKNPRMKLLKDILADEVVGKATVVYNHKYAREILSDQLADYNPVWIKGQMQPNEVTEAKAKFNNDPNCRVILLQTRAAKYGHTLLGYQADPKQACSTQIIFENTYSLDDRSQIEDRIHRHGQEAESVSYYDLIGTSLDRAAVKALQQKEDVFQAVFSRLRSTGRV